MLLFFRIFFGNSQFLFSVEISAHGFSTSGKLSLQKIFLFKKFFCGKKAALCDNFPRTEWRLNSQVEQEKWRTNCAQGEQEKKVKENSSCAQGR